MKAVKLTVGLAALVLLLSVFHGPPAAAQADEDDWAASPADEEYREPYPGFDDLMKRCTAKLSVECGKQVVKGILGKVTDKVSQQCCVRLVAMGRDCHRGLLKGMTSWSDESDQSEVSKIGDAIWYRCLKVANGQPSP